MSILPLIDSESLLPREFKNPSWPFPIHTPMGGGVVGASSAHTPTAGARTNSVVATARILSMMLLTYRLLRYGREALRRFTYAHAPGSRRGLAQRPGLIWTLRRVSRAGREFPREVLLTSAAVRVPPVRQVRAS